MNRGNLYFLNHLLFLCVIAGPFLEVIRSEETTGPVTSLALSAVNKFISYGLIGKNLASYNNRYPILLPYSIISHSPCPTLVSPCSQQDIFLFPHLL
jgi:hypothetical protein